MSCPMSGMNNDSDFKKQVDNRLHNEIRRDFKRVFFIPSKINFADKQEKIESTHVFKKSKSGKVHLIHKITGKAFCSFKIRTLGDEVISIVNIDEKEVCIRCIQLYNTFREKK